MFGNVRASAHSGTIGTGARAKADIVSKSGSEFYSRAVPSIPHIAIFAVSACTINLIILSTT